MAAARSLAVAALLALAACDNPNPGLAVGTFAVASALTVNTCGGDVAPTDPGSFDVTISNDDGIYYWFPNTGGSSVSGKINSARTVSVDEVVADDLAEGGTGGCTLERDDTLSFTLAAGATPASFTGSYSFTVTSAVGSDCGDQLVSGGGSYATLPCTITYKLTGTRQ